MYLKRVVMHGFKSFADRTVVDLDRGVTAIVGPNGCGKSNIADAIKWVLGEQSPKSLRATSMQDVLFEGADTRPAMAFCQVDLLFSDCANELGTAFEEVEISRRVERDGGSNYAINSKNCRLRDIQNLFRDTGIGRVAYSFLQQGQIDKLISANPMDRRTVFEEAAGISGFKVKRDETFKKLQQTEENLLRVGDILREVSGSMSSLKRQAAKAIRAVRLRRQSRALDLALVGYDLRKIDESIEEKQAVIEPAEEDVAAQKAVFDEHESTLRAAEGQLAELLESQQRLSSEIFEVRSQNEEALSNARFLEMRADEAVERSQNLEASVENFQREIDEVKARQSEAVERQAQAKADYEAAQSKTQELGEAHAAAQASYEQAISEELNLKDLSTQQESEVVSLRSKLNALELEKHGLEAALAPLNSQRESVQADKNSLEQERASTQKTLDVTRANIATLKAEIEQLTALDAQNTDALKQTRSVFEDLQRNHSKLVAERDLNEALNHKLEGFGEASKNLLQKGGFKPLVEGLDVETQATKAIEALLSLEIDSVYPETIVTAESLQKLNSGERVALSHWAQNVGETEALDGLTPAINFVKAAGAYDFINARLEGCYVCESAERFADIVRNGAGDDAFVAVVSLDGAMVDCRGLYFAPTAAAENTSYLGRNARLKELAGLIEANETQLHATQDKMVELDQKASQTQTQLKRLSSEAAEANAVLRNLENSLTRQDADIERLASKIENIQQQSANSVERVQAISAERGGLEESFEKAAAQRSESQQRISELSQNLSAFRSQRDEAYTALSEARLHEANALHALESAQETARNAASRLDEVSAQIESTTSQIERLTNDAAEYRQQSHGHKTRSEEFAERLNRLETQLREVRETLSTKDAAQNEQRKQLELLREDLTASQNTLMRSKLEHTELQNRRTAMLEDFEHRFGEEETIENLKWRELLYEADVFAKADEATLELETVELPAEDELEGRYPRFDRSRLFNQSQQIRRQLERLGPINENALEDYKAQEERYESLKAQVDDLSNAKTELSDALDALNAQSSTLFAETFTVIRKNFAQTFEKLFGGGKADLVLSDENDPLNCGIEILARPPGTQLKSLNLLSGGQKTMTAVALLFAIYQVKPSPFCVLDELDAPLDDANIGRFLVMLKSFTAFSQFVIITHNKATMAASNVMYGVTMQERGVSRMLSMRLQEAQAYSQPSPKAKPAKQDDDSLGKARPSGTPLRSVSPQSLSGDSVEAAAALDARKAQAADDYAQGAESPEAQSAQEVVAQEDPVDEDEMLRAAVKAQSYKLSELEKEAAIPQEDSELTEDELEAVAALEEDK